MDQMSQEQRVEQTMSDERVLEAWGISQARRLSRITYLIFVVAMIATVAGAGAYMAFADESLVRLNTSGFWLVVVFAFLEFGLRFVQLRRQRADITDFIPVLSRGLTGDPDHDVEAQAQAEESFTWKSRSVMIVIRMVFAAMVALITINTFQGGVVDLGRQLVFDGCIAVVIAGFAWDQFTFRAELLESELRARTVAAARYQSTPEYKERMRQQREAEEAERAEQEELMRTLAEGRQERIDEQEPEE